MDPLPQKPERGQHWKEAKSLERGSPRVNEPEYVGGIHGVEHALRRGGVSELFVELDKHNARIQTLIDTAQRAGIRVTPVAPQKLQSWVGELRHQGVVARLEPKGSVDLASIIAARGTQAFFLVLDGVQDPHNLGACLRTADAAGVDAVILPKDRAVAVTPTVRKVASGAAESVPIARVTNLARTLREMKEAGIWLVGAADAAAADVYAQDLTGPLALILGAEGQGLRQLTEKHCDFLIRIPMAGEVSSLNVSVACGIVLFEAVRQRRAMTT